MATTTPITRGNNKRKHSSSLSSSISSSSDDEYTLQLGDEQLSTIQKKKAKAVSTRVSPVTGTGKEAKRFFCEECGQGFTRKHGLQRHMTSHTGEKPHACDQCTKAFSLLSSLREHQRTHITSHPYQCNECEKKFTDRSSLRRHARSHSGTLPYACTIEGCNRRFARKDALNAHSRTHKETPSTSYVCTICHQSLSSQAKLTSHLLSHATANKPAVPGASVSLADLDLSKETKTTPSVETSSDDVIVMVKSELDNLVTLPLLATPSLVAEAEAEMQAAISPVSSEGKNVIRTALVCPEVGCGRAFWSRVGLTQHERTHTGDRPFRCGECSATFASRSSLSQHSATHEASSEYYCDWCGSSFNRRGNWERHCAMGICAPQSLDSLLAVPLDLDTPLPSPTATANVVVQSSEEQQQGNWSPASDDSYGGASCSPSSSSHYDADASPSYSVIENESPDATPAWSSPDSENSSIASTSPAYSEYEYNDNVAELLSVVPSASSLIGDALYDPSAPSSSLWGDISLPSILDASSVPL